MKIFEKIIILLIECLFQSLSSNPTAVFIIPKSSEGVTCPRPAMSGVWFSHNFNA